MPNSEGKKRPPGQDKTTQKRKRKPEYARVNAAGVESMKGRESTQEEKYRMLVQNLPCAVYSAYPGKAGPTTFMSNKWKDWTGYSPEELYHNPEAWPRCIHRDDREYAMNTYIEACRDRMAYNLEYRVVHKDTGQIRYVRDQGHLSKDEKGAVVRVDGIVTDITEFKKTHNELDKYRDSLEELVKKRTSELTSAYETLKVENKERKKADQALRQSEEKYRKLFEGAQDGIVLADAETGIIVDCNRAITEMLDMDKSELVGQHQSIIHPPDRIDDGFSVSFRKHVRQSEEQVLEEQVMTRTGRIRDVAIKAKCVQLSDRQLLQGVFHDITERKQPEEALHETTDLLETIFEHTHMLVACLDPNYNFVRVNRAYAEADERQPSFFPGKNHFDLYPNEENEVIFRRVVETGIPYFAYARPFEYAEHPERGGSYWDWGLVPIKNQQGIVSGLVLTLTDVTARKHAEESLKASEGKLKAMLQSISDHMSMMDKDLNIIWANDVVKKRFGNDIIGKKCYEVFHSKRNPCHPQPCLILRVFEDGQVHEQDTEVTDKDGNTMCFHCVANVALRDKEGKATAVLELSKDITDRKHAEEAVREERDRAQKYFDVAGVMFLVIDADKKVKLINQKGCEILGCGEREIIGRDWIENFVPERVRDEVSFVADKLATGDMEEFENFENPVLTRSGEERIIAWHNAVLRDKDGNAVATLCSGADITERKMTEQALKESEKTLRSIFRAAPIGIGLVSNRVLLQVNDKICDMLDYSRDELVGKNSRMLYLSDEIYEYVGREKYKQISECGTGTVEIRWKRKDGRIIDIILNSTVLDPSDFSKGVTFTALDITERKRAEEALRESEGKFRSLAEQSPNMIFINKKGKIVYANKKCEEVIGYTREEFSSPDFDFHSFVTPESLSLINENYARHLRGEEVQPYDYSIIKKDGKRIEAINTSKLIQYEGESAILGIVTDITNRKRAEMVRLAHIHFLESLDQINRAIQGASNLDQMMTDVLDATLSIFNCDRAWLLYPCDPESPSWRVPMERTVPEYPGALALSVEVPMDQGVAGVLRIVLGSDGPVKFGPGSEYPLPHESAKQFRFQSQISMAIYPKVGKPWMFGLHQCSHPRIWTEEDEKLLQEVGRRIADEMSSLLTLRDLRESQERYRALVDNAHLGIALMNTDFDVLMSNAAQGRILRKDHRDIIGGKCYLEFEKRNEICPHCPGRRAMESGHTHEAETEGVRADGTKVSVRVQASPVYGADGRVDGFVEIVEDVTERKRAENALRESEEKHRSMIELSPDAIVVLNKLGVIVSCNSAAQTISGYSKDDLIGRHFTKLGAISLKDIPKYVSIFAKILKGLGHEPFEVDIIRKDGSKGMVEVRVSLLEDGNVQAIATDITERKKAEQALRESEERLKILFESAPDAIYLIDSEGKFIDGNRAAEELIGFTKDEIIGKSLAEIGLLSAGQLSKAKANLKKAATSKLSGPNEYTLKRKNGSHISIEVRTFPVKIGGKMLSLGIARDMTEHKRTEQKLLEHQAKLKSLASQLSLTEELERHRLATNLHDQISQSLVISKIKLDQLRKSSTSDEFNKPLEGVSNCLGQIIDDTRTLTFDLSYPILYELGFEAAVAEWLTDQIQEKHGIRTEFLDDGHQKPLDDDIRVLLFRNVRELLINVVKHAQANKVRVSIRKVKDNIRVSVEDDGVGFDPVEVTSMAAKRAEFGLFSIRERLEQLGGLIEIDSKRRRGSKITMIAPLKNGDEADRE